MFFEAKYESAKCAKQKSVLGSKVCVNPNCSNEMSQNLNQLNICLMRTLANAMFSQAQTSQQTRTSVVATLIKVLTPAQGSENYVYSIPMLSCEKYPHAAHAWLHLNNHSIHLISRRTYRIVASYVVLFRKSDFLHIVTHRFFLGKKLFCLLSK